MHTPTHIPHFTPHTHTDLPGLKSKSDTKDDGDDDGGDGDGGDGDGGDGDGGDGDGDGGDGDGDRGGDGCGDDGDRGGDDDGDDMDTDSSISTRKRKTTSGHTPEMSGHTPDMPAAKRKPLCKYGTKCYQKSVQHREQFDHPSERVCVGTGMVVM